MSRLSLTWPRRTRSEWDRPAIDTRLLHIPLSHFRVPRPFSLPLWKNNQAQRPLSTTAVRRHLGAAMVVAAPPDRGCPRPRADVTRTAPFVAQGPMPALTRRRCSHGYPLRVSPSAVDACPGSPQMYPHSQLPLRASPSAVDARAFARMYCRSAVPGVEADACAFAQAISHAPAPDAPAHTAEGALATSPFPPFSSVTPRSLLPYHSDAPQGIWGGASPSVILSLLPSTELEAEAGAEAPASASILLSPSSLKALRERGIKGVRVLLPPLK